MNVCGKPFDYLKNLQPHIKQDLARKFNTAKKDKFSSWKKPVLFAIGGVATMALLAIFEAATRPFLCRSVTPIDPTGQYENSLPGYLKETACPSSNSLSFTDLVPQQGRSSFTLPSAGMRQRVDEAFLESGHEAAFRSDGHYLSQISSLYDEASSLIQKELKLAEAEGKKLLIIVGEKHDSHNSLISELILAFASHHLGVRDILTETHAQSQIDEVVAKKPINLKKPFVTHQILLPMLLKMGNKFYSVDPLQFKGASEVRNLAINNELVNLNSNSHSIFFCGAAHLTHLASDDLPEVKILQTKYRLLPINTVANNELENGLPIDMRQWIKNRNCS